MKDHKRRAVSLTTRVLLPFGLGYFLCYCLRVVPATIGPDLRDDLGLSNGQLGLLTSAFFFAFAAAQIPLGIALDRFGPRKVQVTLLSVAALGAIGFGLSQTFVQLTIARLVIGLGAAGGLMAAFKAVALWYPRERIPAMNGTVFAFGGLGGMAATVPIERFVLIADWRLVFFLLAGVMLAVVCFIHLRVPRRDEEQIKARPAVSSRQVFSALVKDRRFQFASLANFVCNGTGLALLGLWIGAHMRDVMALTPNVQAQHLLAVNLFNLITFWLIGLTATLTIRKLGWDLRVWLFAGAVGFSGSLIFFGLFGGGLAVWLAVAFASNLATLSYAYVTQGVASEWAGRANGLLNLVVFGAAFGAQYLFGVLLDGRLASGASIAEAYGSVLLLFGLGSAGITAMMLLLWPQSDQVRAKEKGD